MYANFELKSRDGLARIGEFTTQHGKVSTPTIMPVLDPLKPNQLDLSTVRQLGAEIFITNAYLIYKSPEIREAALSKGLHGYLDLDCPVMTDSGAFQLMRYGKVSLDGTVELTNTQITQFEEEIGVDLGVFLDVPVAKGSYEKTKRALKTTLERTDEHLGVRSPDSNVLWVGPVQGGEYLDLLNHASKEMGKREFAVHAIGSVVPLLEGYDYLTVTKMMWEAKRNLPFDRPIHLFGAGHPMLFALSVYMGMDLFDSAAYMLFAKAGRYMTVYGTFHLSELDYFPCACKFCSGHTPKEVVTWSEEDKTSFLAFHNLAVSFEELNVVRQALKEGRLWNLVLQRSATHPKLAEAVRFLTQESLTTELEQYCSISYPKARFYSHPWSTFDPLLTRYRRRLMSRYLVLRDELVITSPHSSQKVSRFAQKLTVDPVFGLVPDEWKNLYPVVQNLSYDMPISAESRSFIQQWVRWAKTQFQHVYALGSSLEYLDLTPWSTVKSEEGNTSPLEDQEVILSLLKYQYAVPDQALKQLLPLKVLKARKSQRLKEFSREGERWATIRASDMYIVPAEPLARWLAKHLPAASMTVRVDDEAEEFVRNGKTVFNRFVTYVDPELRPGDEALVRNENNELLGWGQLLAPSAEVFQYKRGMAVRTRKGISR